MRKITSIEQQKKNSDRANVYLDNEFWAGINKDLILKFNLFAGKELSDYDLSNILNSEGFSKAFNSAVNLLSFSSKTERGLKRKLLEKGFSEDEVLFAVSKCIDYGYINDIQFASSYISDKKNMSGWSRRKIKQSLMEKGIDSSIIDSSLENQYPMDDEFEKCLLAANKKIKHTDISDRKNRDRIYKFLAYRGFSYSTIDRVVNSILED